MQRQHAGWGACRVAFYDGGSPYVSEAPMSPLNYNTGFNGDKHVQYG